ncbi:MAG TPA: non-ribosomal peptide synthetase, partial [Gemmatimonadales bacterium]|nr:non-ribosomal peptide synthetase [Gemmatimonadales bacterium]
LAIRRSDAGTEAVMHTRADLYAPDTGRRLLRLFLTLLNGTAEGMVRQVSRLPLFEGDERERVLGLAAGYELPTRITRTVGELFLEQAGRNPGKTALIAENGTWTFATLAERAQALADELSRRGIGCGDVVAVVADRTLESVMAMVAVTLSGAAYLPADFDQPAERMQVMLADSGARLVLTDAAGETRLATSVPVQRFDRPGPVVTGAPSSRRAGPDDPVYVLFTSGSTGRPKGVMIPHRALINHMDWALDAFPIGPSDVILHRTPIGFDASVWEIWGPLFAGCPMVLARRSSDADPAYLREAIRTHGVTELQVVPSMLSLMVELNGFDGCDTLKRVFCGGEALPAELVRRFQAAHPAELNNLYGPTEVTIDAIWWRIPPGFSETSVPIGRPIPNVRAYVLDRQGEPTPIGVPGELYLGGVGVGLGYLNRPDLTEQRFRPDPFAGHGGRMYRTGDRARFQADGNLEFLGRLDDQLKLHGMRIEPGEIEAVMNARPDVLESAVGIVDSEWTGSRLVAWVVLHPGNTASADAFRADLASSLPRSLVPSGVLFLEKLPKLPSGKIDRRSLPAPIADMAEAASFQAPDTPTEQFVARVWAEILGRERVGRHDDLFLLGGHSLLAIRIANRLRGPVGVEITLETILEHPTVFSLAAELDRRATTAPHEVEASLPRIPRAARVQRHSAPRPPSVP